MSSERPNRVAVTGASGFVGHALVQRLQAEGREVIALSRSPGARPQVGVSFVQMESYDDAVALTRSFEGIEAVVHLAARAHRGGSDADFDGNVTAAVAAAQAAQDAGASRFVLVSSIGVNGNVTRTAPFRETDAPAPVEPYARSKWRAEQAVTKTLQGSGTRLVILRPPLIYGPHAPGNFAKLVRAVQKGWPLPLGAIRNARSLVGIDNLLELIACCIDHPAAAGELFLVADGEDLSTPQLVRCIAEGLGRPAHLWPVPPALLRFGAALAGRPRIAESLCDSLQVDASKARRLLGWVPRVQPQEGVRDAARASRRAP